MEMEAIIGARQVALLAAKVKRRENEGHVWWTLAPGTLAAQARTWMKKCGWAEEGERK